MVHQSVQGLRSEDKKSVVLSHILLDTVKYLNCVVPSTRDEHVSVVGIVLSCKHVQAVTIHLAT